MTTVGGSLPLVPLGLELSPMAKRSTPLPWPACWPAPLSAPMPMELGGRGLLRMSLTAVDEDVGVSVGD